MVAGLRLFKEQLRNRSRSNRRAGLIWFVVTLGGYAHAQSTAEKVSYNFEVRPILAAKCFGCHGSDAANRKGDLRLDRREEAIASAIAPGDAGNSELMRRIVSQDPDEVMPPPSKHSALTKAQAEILGRWIEQGAEFEQHWAFLPPEAPSAESLDDLVSARLEKKGWKAAPGAEKYEWLRRVTLALNGMVPTVEELDAFLADADPKAKEHVVDRLLARPAYGERMAAIWLDAARYADTYGRHEDQDNSMWPWRDWVIRAFNDNLPYDQFLTWQMAGDLLPQATQDQKVATGFHRLAVMTNEAGSNPEENRWMQIFDRVQVTSTAILGLTLECAQCHDHKFDPFTMRDYYQMAAFFDKGDEFGLFPRFCNGTPPPSAYVYQAGQETEQKRLKRVVKEAEDRLEAVRKSARERFDEWRRHSAPPLRGGGLWEHAWGGEHADRVPSVMPEPQFATGFEAVDEKEGDFHLSVSPPMRTRTPAVRSIEPGVVGRACDFPAGSGGLCEFPPELAYFRKHSPFTFSFWLKVKETPERAVILHRCRAGVDTGHRGYDLMFLDGKLTLTLGHFFPGNAIRVQAEERMDFPNWRHLALSYDGSSRAGGVHLFVDGQEVETRIIRDSLTRDIDYRSEWADGNDGQVADGSQHEVVLSLGQSNNETGLLGAAIDELRVYDRKLSPVEILFLSGKPVPEGDEPWFDWYFREVDVEGVRALATLNEARAKETDFDVGLRDIMVMEDTPGLGRVTPMLKRGDFRSPGEVVEPGTPAALPPMPEGAPRNRLGLAQWLVDKRHPLTARVQANRLWSVFFGQGLVRTPQDFGVQGEVPAQPELLDFLARRLMDLEWDMKAFCRELALSEVFARSSLPVDAEQWEFDPDNTMLARGPRLPLTAEQLRDSALRISGLLNPVVGGPSVKPYQPEGLWEDSATQHVYEQDKGSSLYRRSLYTFWRRTCPPPTMTLFDAPSREVCLVKRTSTVSPLQVLAVWNDKGYLEAARVLAERLVGQHPSADADAQRVEDAIRALTGKSPIAAQTLALVELIQSGREEYSKDREQAGQLLAAAGESPLQQGLPPEEVAATLVMVRALFSADAFVNVY
jgi:hypothetical protein